MIIEAFQLILTRSTVTRGLRTYPIFAYLSLTDEAVETETDEFLDLATS